MLWKPIHIFVTLMYHRERRVHWGLFQTSNSVRTSCKWAISISMNIYIRLGTCRIPRLKLAWVQIHYNEVFCTKKRSWNFPYLDFCSKFGHHISSNSRVALPSTSLQMTLLMEVGRCWMLCWNPAKPADLAIAFRSSIDPPFLMLVWPQ